MAMAAIINPIRPAEKTEPKFFRGMARVSEMEGREEANALGIEAVEQQHQAAQRNRRDLKPAQRLPVDDLAYGESARPGGIHEFPPGHEFPAGPQFPSG